MREEDDEEKKLPEGGKHFVHWRPRAAHRSRTAENPEFGQEVPDGNQGRVGVTRSVPGHAPGQLAAGEPEERRAGIERLIFRGMEKCCDSTD